MCRERVLSPGLTAPPEPVSLEERRGPVPLPGSAGTLSPPQTQLRSNPTLLSYIFLLKFQREGRREEEKQHLSAASCGPRAGDRARDLSVRDRRSPTEPHYPGGHPQPVKVYVLPESLKASFPLDYFPPALQSLLGPGSHLWNTEPLAVREED